MPLPPSLMKQALEICSVEQNGDVISSEHMDIKNSSDDSRELTNGKILLFSQVVKVNKMCFEN